MIYIIEIINRIQIKIDLYDFVKIMFVFDA